MKLFLDDIRIPSEMYGDDADTDWFVTSSVEMVKQSLLDGIVTHLSLDNDLGPDEPEGHTIVTWMIFNNIWPSEEIYVHSANIVRSKQMREDINRYYYGCVKVQWKREQDRSRRLKLAELTRLSQEAGGYEDQE